MTDAVFGKLCSGSGITEDFVAKYKDLRNRYNNEISNHIDSTLERFKKLIRELRLLAECFDPTEVEFPFTPNFPLATEFLLAARSTAQLHCDKETNCQQEVIDASKLASFREIKNILENLWLQEPTPPPIGLECAEGRDILLSPNFSEMSLLIQTKAIRNIEKDCFRIPLEEKYAKWYSKFPKFQVGAENNDCPTTLYGEFGYCKGK